MNYSELCVKMSLFDTVNMHVLSQLNEVNLRTLSVLTCPARRTASMRRKRSGTIAPRRSWWSSWCAWIRSTGRWTSMPPWRRWRRRCRRTWTSQRTLPTKPEETIKPTSLLSTVQIWYYLLFLIQSYIWTAQLSFKLVHKHMYLYASSRIKFDSLSKLQIT